MDSKKPCFYGDYLTHIRWRDFKHLGAWPVLYNGGKRTFHRGIPSSDLAEAIIRIVKHPDSPGHTFELYNENRHELQDIVSILMEAQDEVPHFFNGIKTKIDPETLERTLEPANKYYAFKQWALRCKFGYYTARRPIPRALDMWNRHPFTKNTSFGWMNEPYFNMLNQTCRIENPENPGLKDLGIIPGKLEDSARQMMQRWTMDLYRVHNSKSLKNYPLKHHPEENDHLIQVTESPEDYQFMENARERDQEIYNWDWENDMRTEWAKLSNASQNNTIDMRPTHYEGAKSRIGMGPRDVRQNNPNVIL